MHWLIGWVFDIRTESCLNVTLYWFVGDPFSIEIPSSRASLRIQTVMLLFVNIYVFAYTGVIFIQQLFTLSVKQYTVFTLRANSDRYCLHKV